MIKFLDLFIYFASVALPFSVAIAKAPMNAFCGMLIAGCLAKRIIQKERLLPRLGVNLPLLLLFAATFISFFHTVSFKDSWRGGFLRLLEFSAVMLVIAVEVRSSRHLRHIVYGVLAGLLLASFDGIWQVITGRDFLRGNPAIVNIGLVRATAGFSDSNVLGIYLSGLAPLIFGIALFSAKGAKRILWLAASLVIISGVALTYSRPTLLAVFAALCFLGVALKSKKIVAVLLILVLLSPLLLPLSFKSWAKEMEYNPLRMMCNDDRIAIYQHSLRMIKAHPFIGVGANTFVKNYKKYKVYPEYRNIVTPDEIVAHNMFLHLAAELGLFGLGAFFFMLWRIFSAATGVIRRAGNNRQVKVIAVSLTACLIAFLVNGLTESSFQYASVLVVFWLCAGLLLSLERIANQLLKD